MKIDASSYPSPAFDAPFLVQFENSNGKQATKSISELRARVKYSCPEGELLSRVEQREVEERARKENRL